MQDIAQQRTNLSAADIDHLQLLLSEWTLISDLSFADLILWVPTWDATGFISVGQMRPSTARTHVEDDLFGRFAPTGTYPYIDQAFTSGTTTLGEANSLHSFTQAIPVRREEKVIAIIGRYRNEIPPGRLEETYTKCAEDLIDMVSHGMFPLANDADQGTGGRGGTPRVGDGLIVMDNSGGITYASPNARSAFRRLGVEAEIEHQVLADVVSRLNRQGVPIDDTLSLVARGQIQGTSEIHYKQAAATVRSIPLSRSGESKRTLILVRDVTDLRRREQALLGKDAAIREIHHRVKNNLQTVSSLLRLQGRRLTDENARIAISEAGRRVATIAVVHELLAHNPGSIVDFDDVADRVITLTIETSTREKTKPYLAGVFGELPSEKATTLALVLAELVANAIEHATIEGEHLDVDIHAFRKGDQLTVTISDNGPGIGLPVSIDGGLGLAIVSTLVTDELRGTIVFSHVNEDAKRPGTKIVVAFPNVG